MEGRYHASIALSVTTFTLEGQPKTYGNSQTRERALMPGNGMVRPCSSPASKLRWQGAPKTRSARVPLAGTSQKALSATNPSLLAWISTERNSPYIMSLESTIFRAFRSEITVTCHANWCADSLVARRHFALSYFDFRSFRISVGKITPGSGGYQSTNMPYTNERIPESHESLADSNVRGICLRGNPG